MSNAKWMVRYENGKPVACGFSALKGADVREYADVVPEILETVKSSKDAAREQKKTARKNVISKLAAALALTDAEIKALFGG